MKKMSVKGLVAVAATTGMLGLAAVGTAASANASGYERDRDHNKKCSWYWSHRHDEWRKYCYNYQHRENNWWHNNRGYWHNGHWHSYYSSWYSY